MDLAMKMSGDRTMDRFVNFTKKREMFDFTLMCMI
jgi:hypothetical protein